MSCHKYLKPAGFKKLVQDKKFQSPTTGVCAGYKQANTLIIEKSLNFIEKLAKNNYGPLPILAIDRTTPFETLKSLPRFVKIAENGAQDVEINIDELDADFINQNYVAYKIGCSFSFEDLLISNDIPVRNIEQQCNVSMYQTEIKLVGFLGRENLEKPKMVVSMRPIPKELVEKVIKLTSHKSLEDCHGSPVAIGFEHAKKMLGIDDCGYFSKAIVNLLIFIN